MKLAIIQRKTLVEREEAIVIEVDDETALELEQPDAPTNPRLGGFIMTAEQTGFVTHATERRQLTGGEVVNVDAIDFEDLDDETIGAAVEELNNDPNFTPQIRESVRAYCWQTTRDPFISDHAREGAQRFLAALGPYPTRE